MSINETTQAGKPASETQEKAIEEKAATHAKQPEKSHMHSKDAATPTGEATGGKH